jgi:hypothetical protein
MTIWFIDVMSFHPISPQSSQRISQN